jgi:hypothetical protein
MNLLGILIIDFAMCYIANTVPRHETVGVAEVPNPIRLTRVK